MQGVLCGRGYILAAHTQWRRNEYESGGTGPARKWGHPSCAKRRKKFFGRAPLLFWLNKYNSRLVSAFVMVSTVWSVSCLLLFYSRYPPPCSATCKSGGGRTCPPCTMESAPLPTHRVNTNKKYEKWTLLSADAMTFNLLTLPCKLSKSESLSLCYNHLQAG